MITFKELNETKDELKDAKALKNRLKTIESAYDKQTRFNRKLMQQLNILIGKYFTEPKKAYAHEYKDSNGKTTATLQISKAGIGRTLSWNTNITPFTALINTNEQQYTYSNKGLIGEVIIDKNIYGKVHSHLSSNGQYILESLKEVYENNKVVPPDCNKLNIAIRLSDVEKNILNVKKETYINIIDRGRVPTISISKEKDTDEYTYTNGQVFCLNDIDLNNERDFIYALYTQYHSKELNDALDKYLAETKERMDVWNNFNEELKEKLAKFLVLMTI
jgi:hypothetical protein